MYCYLHFESTQLTIFLYIIQYWIVVNLAALPNGAHVVFVSSSILLNKHCALLTQKQRNRPCVFALLASLADGPKIKTTTIFEIPKTQAIFLFISFLEDLPSRKWFVNWNSTSKSCWRRSTSSTGRRTTMCTKPKCSASITFANGRITPSECFPIYICYAR